MWLLPKTSKCVMWQTIHCLVGLSARIQFMCSKDFEIGILALGVCMFVLTYSGISKVLSVISR